MLSDSEEEFDRILEKYKEDRKAAGYDRVMAERTRQMKENKARLKME